MDAVTRSGVTGPKGGKGWEEGVVLGIGLVLAGVGDSVGMVESDIVLNCFTRDVTKLPEGLGRMGRYEARIFSCSVGGIRKEID